MVSSRALPSAPVLLLMILGMMVVPLSPSVLDLMFTVNIAVSLVVAVETVMRKVFNVSLQGADELGGYALAVGATIAFSMALLGRTQTWERQ